MSPAMISDRFPFCFLIPQRQIPRLPLLNFSFPGTFISRSPLPALHVSELTLLALVSRLLFMQPLDFDILGMDKFDPTHMEIRHPLGMHLTG